MNIFDWGEAEMQAIPDVEEEYDSPHGSRWIVAVADDGSVFVLSRPNIHYSFFDNGDTAEEIGLPFEVDGPAGVYEWICSFDTITDYETGNVDSWEFNPTEEKLLYSWDNGKANESGNEAAQQNHGSGEL